MSFKVVIPARYQSTRLIGKPLLEIDGVPMIIHVITQSLKSNASEVIVATDDTRIHEVVRQHGYQCVFTDPGHTSGTSRVVDVVGQFRWAPDEIIVNVQGDEPLIDPDLINRVASKLLDSRSKVDWHDQLSISTACYPITTQEEFLNPNIVKVILDKNSNALYFSRSAIPWQKDTSQPTDACKHIGIYAYTADFLMNRFNRLLRPNIEQVENLEQLRMLYSGYRINVVVAQNDPLTGVNCIEDLEKVRALYEVISKLSG